MNLQTDNDMKRVLLFCSLMLLLGNIEGNKNPKLSNFNPTKNESNSILTGEDIQLSFYS